MHCSYFMSSKVCMYSSVSTKCWPTVQNVISYLWLEDYFFAVAILPGNKSYTVEKLGHFPLNGATFVRLSSTVGCEKSAKSCLPVSNSLFCYSVLFGASGTPDWNNWGLWVFVLADTKHKYQETAKHLIYSDLCSDYLALETIQSAFNYTFTALYSIHCCSTVTPEVSCD